MSRRRRHWHPSDPDAPEASRCPECDSVVTEEGDKFDWTVTCPACGLIAEGGIDPQDYLEQQAAWREPSGDVW